MQGMINRRHDEETLFLPKRHVHVGIRHEAFDQGEVEFVVGKRPNHVVSVPDADFWEAPAAAPKFRERRHEVVRRHAFRYTQAQGVRGRFAENLREMLGSRKKVVRQGEKFSPRIV